MSETLERAKARARELARSGRFVSWRAVAFELRFEPEYFEGLAWINSPAAQEEIDLLCRGARARSPILRRDASAA